MFWWGWPSWRTELLGGAALAAALLGVSGGAVPFAAVFSALTSLVYEFALDERREDPSHRPWEDVGQRAAGSLALLLLYSVLRACL